MNATAQGAVNEQCPQCSAPLEPTPGYTTWCEPCGWNANPDEARRKRDLLDRLNDRLGPKVSERLLREFGGLSAERKRRWMNFGAGAFGAALLAGDLYLLYVGIRMLISISTAGEFFIGSFITAAGIVLRPRLIRWKHRGLVRADYPGLYRLLDQIAERMQAKPVDMLMMGTTFNASFVQSDLTRKKLIMIGIPLFSILTLEEKIFVLAHEMAHNANRDMSRDWLSRNGQITLSVLYKVLSPYGDYREVFGPFFYVMWYARKLLAFLVFGVYYIHGLLRWRDSQYAEYAADGMASRVSGTTHAVSALDKLHYNATFYSTVERIARYGYNNDLFGELRKVIGEVPDKELRRIKRVVDKHMARLDSTHPPTTLRKRHIEGMPIAETALVLDDEHKAQLEREFAELERKTQRHLLERYRAYFG